MSNKLIKNIPVKEKKMRNPLKILKNSKVLLALNIVAMLVLPIVIFYTFEWFTHNPFETMNLKPQLLNIFFFEVLTLFLFFVCGRLRLALRIETIFFLIYGLANYYVIEFRSAPIMPWDLFSIRTAASVANNYQYTVERQTVVIVLIFVALFILERTITLELPKSPAKKRHAIKIVGALASFAVIYLFTCMLHEDSSVSRFDLYDKYFTPTVVNKKDGNVVAFLMELEYVTVEKPEGYSIENAETILAQSENTEVTSSDTSNPNIIVIMNEAFSDPAILGEFETNVDYMPFVHSIMSGEVENTISGYLNVSVLGGNTANTEFEFLTGNTMAFLPQGSIPYQQYVKSEVPSVASQLTSLGYETIAMHPYNSTGWQRNTVYPLFGFQQMYFINDWDNPEKIRKYVSDKSCYDKIISLYEQKDESPLFIFNVTMQNHSSYTDEYDNFTPDVTVENVKSTSLTNYLSLIKKSDEAIEYLVDYFSQVDEDTIIVFFGDHQTTNSVMSPIMKLNGKSFDSLTDEENNDRYKVPYFIWANYDIEDASDLETSANYLGMRTLQAADLPLSSYQSFLSELSQSFPVISSIRAQSADGTSKDVKDVKDELNSYQTLQYYYLFDYE